MISGCKVSRHTLKQLSCCGHFVRKAHRLAESLDKPAQDFGINTLDLLDTFMPLTNDARKNPSKLDKVAAIVNSAAVHEHLRVCWENRTEGFNCGACEKCIRTQLQFITASDSALGKLRSFPKGNVRERIKAIEAVSPHLWPQWKEMRDNIAVSSLASESQLLLDRSRPIITKEFPIKGFMTEKYRAVRAMLD